jgi:hypothetical protein
MSSADFAVREPTLSQRYLDLEAVARQQALTLDCPAHVRARALENWQGRMLNEYQSHYVFAELGTRVAEAGFGSDLAEACARFGAEEQHHGALCGAVVCALGGRAAAWVDAPRSLPLYDDVSPKEAVARHVLSVCCLSETVAVALIGAERLQMGDGPLRRLLSDIYADEVGHARFGWRFVQRHVTSWSWAAKRRLSSYLSVALAHLEAHQLAHISGGAAEPGQSGLDLGLCNGADSRALFYNTVRQVIVPQLERVGLSARAAWQERSVACRIGAPAV